MNEMIIAGGDVFDPCTRTFSKKDIALKDGRICSVESVQDKACTVVDAGGCLVPQMTIRGGRIAYRALDFCS